MIRESMALPSIVMVVFVLAIVAARHYDFHRAPTCDIIDHIISTERPQMGPLERKFWSDAIRAVSAKHGLPPEIIAAKIAQESRFRAQVVSSRGAKGPAQLMPMWVKGFDPYEIELNLDKGAEVLAAELKATGGDINRALRRYNGGPGGERIPETEGYAARVLARAYLAERACSNHAPVGAKE